MDDKKEYLENINEEMEKIMADQKILTNCELNGVTGGSKREKTIVVSVELKGLPYSGDVIFKPYIDGVLKADMVKTIDPSYVSIINLNINGITGIKRLDVKVNDQLYKTYEVNFDENSYREC